MNNDTIGWREIGEKLRAPFNPADVDFRVQGRVNEQTGKGQVVAYVDARCVQDRLDEVVGPGNWSFEWEPVVIDKGDVQVAKGILTIHGVAKSDVGTASNFEASLGAVSHCLKRAAVHFGIGRYLYSVSSAWVAVEKSGQNWRIPEQVLRDLRAHLPRPVGTPAEPQQQQTPQHAPATSSPRHTQPAAPASNKPRDPMDTTIASAEEQTRLAEKLRAAGYDTLTTAQGFLNDTASHVDALALKQGTSDLTLRELAAITQRLTRVQANGKAGATR